MGTHPIFESDFDCLTERSVLDDDNREKMSDNVLDSHDVVDSECVDNFGDNVPMLKRRLSHAQKSIEFLQDQHKQTLNELHREIDRLKLQNKDQQWKLVMSGALPALGQDKFRADCAVQANDPSQADREFRLKVLEQDNLDLKAKCESLMASNEKFKNELINRTTNAKSGIEQQRQQQPRKYHDTKYRSRFQRKEKSPKTLPLIGGCQINGNQVEVHFPRLAPTTTTQLPQLRGVNQTVKHNRRLDAIHHRNYQY